MIMHHFTNDSRKERDRVENHFHKITIGSFREGDGRNQRGMQREGSDTYTSLKTVTRSRGSSL